MAFYNKSSKEILATGKEESNELHAYAANGQQRQLRIALEKTKQGIKQTTLTHKLTLLNVAVIYGHIDCVRILIQAGADLCEKTPSLCLAIRLKKENIALILLAEMLKRDALAIKTLESKGHYPLVNTARHGTATIAAALIAAKADIENGPKEYPRQTPMLTAARNGQTQIIRLLLHLKPTLLDQKDFNKATPLYHAAYRGREETVRALLDAKATFTGGGPKISPLKMTLNRQQHVIAGLLLSVYIEKSIPLKAIETQTLIKHLPEPSLIQKVSQWFVSPKTPPAVAEPLKHLQTPRTLLSALNQTDILLPGLRKIVGEYAKPSNLQELTPYLTKPQ